MRSRLQHAVFAFVGWFGNTRVVTRLHPIAYRALGGRGVLSQNLGVLNVILTTTGRRTGEPRDAPLYAFPDGDRYVVVASRAGHDHEPAWAGNLRANPRARLRIRGRVLEVEAAEVRDAERDRLWDLVTRGYPGYLDYQRRTTRVIPLFVLTPVRED